MSKKVPAIMYDELVSAVDSLCHSGRCMIRSDGADHHVCHVRPERLYV